MELKIQSTNSYEETYRKSVDDPEMFWSDVASQFTWRKRWEKVVDWDFVKPDVKWFIGGKLNITENCLDRHVAERPDQAAIVWEPNNPEEDARIISYRELFTEVCKCANALKAMGITKGDRVCFYMPMIPELAIAMLACARIGAVHSIVFAGFSAKALADRINDAECKMVICSDYNQRGAKNIEVKKVVDDALDLGCPSIEKVLVYKHTGEDVKWNSDVDVWWQDVVPGQSGDCIAEEMDSEDMLSILYTSGSTGKPKGVVHTCGGYMVYATYSFLNVFQYEPGDIYWCTADIGWITGHSYIVYGPLAAGATTVMFEGVPTYPDAGRFWAVCDKLKVNQFYTAPTAIRALMKYGNEIVEKYDLSTLKVLGTVGEPINEEAWHWYQNEVGKGKLPIVDTWWQTETGGIMITPIPGVTELKPCFATYPLPGIQPCLVDSNGEIIEENEKEGYLCIQYPWPSMLRTTYGDHERCRHTYFDRFKNKYFTGDAARRDAEGRYRIIGRVDDVINVSGHRIGTAEVENAIDEHNNVVEAAVVGYPHEIKGQGIFAFIVENRDDPDDEKIAGEIRDVVRDIIGPIAKPDRIMVVNGLPKTRSGKIMRRILRKLAADEKHQLGDISTLLNPEIVDSIIKRMDAGDWH